MAQSTPDLVRERYAKPDAASLALFWALALA